MESLQYKYDDFGPLIEVFNHSLDNISIDLVLIILFNSCSFVDEKADIESGRIILNVTHFSCYDVLIYICT